MLRPVRHESLRVLRFESGGLPGHVVRATGACDLPALEHLEMWLGVERYGGDATAADLEPILSGERLPALRHLGLQDSAMQDEIAAAVATAPVVARLESLALSMGVLTDEGAEALLSGQPLTHLKRLDLHHHFLSDAMTERVRAALPGSRWICPMAGERAGTTGATWRSPSERPHGGSRGLRTAGGRAGASRDGRRADGGWRTGRGGAADGSSETPRSLLRGASRMRPSAGDL
nr:hypothetical protein GCM10020093_003410 [Planobispora longispora]